MIPRPFVLAAILLGIVPSFAQSPTPAATTQAAVAADPAATAKQAFLHLACGGGWSPALKAAFLRHARAQTLAACAAKNLQLPQEFLAWIDADPIVSASVYGTRADPLHVLLGLRSLEIDLGEQTVRRDYTQLALAFAINSSHRGWTSTPAVQNDSRNLNQPFVGPDVSPRETLKLTIPGDPRVRINTKDPTRPLDRNDPIINFLEDHAEIDAEIVISELPPLEYDSRGIAKPRKERPVTKNIQRKPTAADVIASPALQQEFNSYMKAKGHEVTLDCGDRVVHWSSTKSVPGPQAKKINEACELFREAYRAKGRLPKARDAAATPAESMAWFIRNDRHPFTAAERKARQWPRFPFNAPWPVLMMLADDDQPLREREEIWAKFRDHGEMKTYGEYIGDIAQQYDMQSARRLAPFAFDYGTIEMMWKDGGVCGTMASIGARTLRICGIPAATAAQPGHCALVQMDYNPQSGHYTCKGGQYAGGDDVTQVHYNWYFDETGRQVPMVYHQSLAWAVNHGLPAFLDAMLCLQLSRQLPQSEAAQRLKLLEQGLDLNPYAIVLVDAAIPMIKQPPELARFVERCTARLDQAAKLPSAPDAKLYRLTLERKCKEASVALTQAPKDRRHRM
ncbi:MAG: hypothetical protein NTW21_00845 [Verrucomicrobia bacterium]|nr:hypothetical protein [Verrucomicrobiota bacterium]